MHLLKNDIGELRRSEIFIVHQILGAHKLRRSGMSDFSRQAVLIVWKNMSRPRRFLNLGRVCSYKQVTPNGV